MAGAEMPRAAPTSARRSPSTPSLATRALTVARMRSAVSPRGRPSEPISRGGAPLSTTTAAEPALSLANLKHDTKILSSDAFEGRSPMSAGGDRAVAYIVAAMPQAGLKPGFHGSYVQAIPMLQVE